MLQNLLSAAVVIGALRVKKCYTVYSDKTHQMSLCPASPPAVPARQKKWLGFTQYNEPEI